MAQPVDSQGSLLGLMTVFSARVQVPGLLCLFEARSQVFLCQRLRLATAFH